ncbi:MAG TPA: RDD family protein [Phototrophicaceae bacterium]|nr:RDD family protein [Phototrophicaceae bacterium]
MDDLASKLSIDTPENILLDAEIAGFGTRCMAAIIDYTILLLLMAVAAYLFSRAIPDDAQNESGTVAVFVLLQFSLITFYHLLFELFWNGQTPGKRWTGIRVIQANGLPATTAGIIIRNLVRVFDFLPIFYGFGMLVLFASKNTQRLGDLAAKTVVVREQRHLTLKTIKEDWRVTYQHVKAIDPIPPYIHLENLSLDDRRSVVDYLRRRDTLTDRDHLAPLVALRIARKMADPNLEQELNRVYSRRVEKFLEQVARAFEIQDIANR